MDHRVSWAEPALADLDATAEYIARDSPLYAAVFVKRVRSAARSLQQHPERGRRVPEAREPDVREIFVNHYRLTYEVSGSTVYVLARVHTARDLASLWEREGRPHPDE